MQRSALFMAGALLYGLPNLAAAQSVQPQAPSESLPVCPPGTVYSPPGSIQAPPAQPSEQEAPPPYSGAPSTIETVPVYPTQPPPPPVVRYQPVSAPRAERPRPAFSPYQQSLTVGGGVADFVRDRINDNTSVAGTWDVRYLLGTRSFIGFEAAYQGTAGEINETQGFDPGAIITHQTSGSLRLNATRSRIQPFVTAGGGWMNLHRDGPETLTGVQFQESKNAFVAPFGAGLTGYIGRHGVLDLRGNYDLVARKAFTNTGARPDMWTAELRLGYAF